MVLLVIKSTIVVTGICPDKIVRKWGLKASVHSLYANINNNGTFGHQINSSCYRHLP